MESNILALLQGKTSEGLSKWQELSVKHEVMSSRKEFPLKEAKPEKSKRSNAKPLTAYQLSALVKAGCFGSQEVSPLSLSMTHLTCIQRASQVEQMLVSGTDSFRESDLV